MKLISGMTHGGEHLIKYKIDILFFFFFKRQTKQRTVCIKKQKYKTAINDKLWQEIQQLLISKNFS